MFHSSTGKYLQQRLCGLEKPRLFAPWLFAENVCQPVVKGLVDLFSLFSSFLIISVGKLKESYFHISVVLAIFLHQRGSPLACPWWRLQAC